DRMLACFDLACNSFSSFCASLRRTCRQSFRRTARSRSRLYHAVGACRIARLLTETIGRSYLLVALGFFNSSNESTGGELPDSSPYRHTLCARRPALRTEEQPKLIILAQASEPATSLVFLFL